MSNANYPKQSEQPPPPVHPMEANQIISANGVTRSKMGTGTVQVPMQVPPQTPIINVTAAPERDPNMCHCCGCTCPYWACIIVFVVVIIGCIISTVLTLTLKPYDVIIYENPKH